MICYLVTTYLMVNIEVPNNSYLENISMLIDLHTTHIIGISNWFTQGLTTFSYILDIKSVGISDKYYLDSPFVHNIDVVLDVMLYTPDLHLIIIL